MSFGVSPLAHAYPSDLSFFFCQNLILRCSRGAQVLTWQDCKFHGHSDNGPGLVVTWRADSSRWNVTAPSGRNLTKGVSATQYRMYLYSVPCIDVQHVHIYVHTDSTHRLYTHVHRYAHTNSAHKVHIQMPHMHSPEQVRWRAHR